MAIKPPPMPEFDVPIIDPPSGRLTAVWWEWLQRFLRWGDESNLSDGDKGDIVVSDDGSTIVFDPTVVTPAAKTVLDDPTTAAMRTTLGAEPVITAGTTAQYWRGDKSWQTLPAPGIDQTTADGRYVNVTGDTMSGDLVLDKASAGNVRFQKFALAGNAAWGWQYYSDGNLYLSRFNSGTGAAIDNPLTINGSTGAVSTAGNFTAGGSVFAAGDTAFGIWTSGGNRNFAFYATTSFYADTSANINVYQLGAITAYWQASDKRLVNLGPAYKPGGGAWLDSSDARIKSIVEDYTAGLAEVLQLQPRRYTFLGNDTPTDPEADRSTVPPFAGSPHFQAATNGQQFIGLVAQEAEVAMPEMVLEVEGWIDGVEVDDLREMDTTPLVYALVNSIKELAAMNEALEARVAALEGIG
jgi:hypothetical protein